MTKTTRRFLIWTFTLTYGCWGAIILANQFDYLKYGTPVSMVLFLLGGLSPTIVSYYYLKKTNRISGFKGFLKEVFKVKQSPKFYLLMVVLLAFYFVIPFATGSVTFLVPIYLLPVLMLQNIIGGGLEELGWRYILQDDLEKKYSFIVSTIITGVIWAVWHVPLFYIAGTSQQSMMTFLPFAILVIGFSFILGILYHTSKSIWLCVLCHTLINSLNSCFLFLDKVTIITSSMISVLLMTVSLLVLLYNFNNLRNANLRVKIS